MELTIKLAPNEGKMAAYAKYGRDEITKPHFYLNRDVEIEGFWADGQEINSQFDLFEHPCAWEGYKVKRFAIPPFCESLEIKYSLVLSGQTGSYPYVREKITPEFSLLRQETFCYPMFYDNWDEYWKPDFRPCDVNLEVPAGYDAVTAYDQAAGFFSCAIAPYVKTSFSFGDIYFLASTGEETKQMVEETMAAAQCFMNTSFGARRINPDLKFAVIPDGLGSFARPDAIFIVESTFKDKQSLNQIIHEFIHLGWDVEAKTAEVQRCRFFDEAFTCYFEKRVMEFLIPDYAIRHRERLEADLSKHKAVSISKYGEMGLSDLSYTIGALCLQELCEALGQEKFDAATKVFLEKFRETGADFEDFCDTYKSQGGTENEEKLTSFFKEWIY